MLCLGSHKRTTIFATSDIYIYMYIYLGTTEGSLGDWLTHLHHGNLIKGEGEFSRSRFLKKFFESNRLFLGTRVA